MTAAAVIGYIGNSKLVHEFKVEDPIQSTFCGRSNGYPRITKRGATRAEVECMECKKAKNLG